jgi:hypothetical protein
LTSRVRHVTVQPEALIYRPGQTIDLTGRNRWLADDTTAWQEPDRDMTVRADRVVEAVNDDQSFADLTRAHVTYASSDPTVLTVNANGLARAVRDGVATLTVTVDGIPGQTVIAVRSP